MIIKNAICKVKETSSNKSMRGALVRIIAVGMKGQVKFEILGSHRSLRYNNMVKFYHGWNVDDLDLISLPSDSQDLLFI